jgi:hypothetical protein
MFSPTCSSVSPGYSSLKSRSGKAASKYYRKNVSEKNSSRSSTGCWTPSIFRMLLPSSNIRYVTNKRLQHRELTFLVRHHLVVFFDLISILLHLLLLSLELLLHSHLLLLILLLLLMLCCFLRLLLLLQLLEFLHLNF